MSYERLGIRLGFVPCVSNTTPKVYPSGAALATAAVPIAPDAPPMFSTTTLWPSCLLSCCASTRATWSTDPPGGKTEISRTGLSGQVWPPATPTSAERTLATSR